MIGRTLGHFQILEKIGSGGMGEVYRARDQHLERDVAVKVLPPGMLADDAARKRFRQEALALSKLNHPNIATVHDFVSESQADFLVMECVTGTTLGDRLASGPLPEKDILALGAQLAEGLAAAHEQGVIHCDLKPGNLRVTPDGRLKVLDFGLARFLGPAGESVPTQSEALIKDAAGTLPYMAPEQLNGSAPDTRSDLYSAGAVLYEMATGQRLFPHEREPQRQLVAILHQVPRAPTAINPHISAGLEGVILKCLEKDPDHRYQSAREIVADLRRLGATTSLINVTADAASRRSRRAMMLWLVGAAVALALAGGAWFLHSRAGTGEIHSLAVLPFVNLSNNPDQEYFVDGMTDSLITEMGQAGALRVISRTSVMQYRGAKKSVGEIARELHVDAVVEGSVWRSSNQVRVTARLIRATTDTQLWSRSYDKDVRDLLSLQRDLASSIAREIRVTLTPQEKERLASTRPVNPAALEAYLQGMYLGYGNNAQHRKAKEYFEQAISLDPTYAPAYVGLAQYYWGTTELPARVALPQAEQYAQKALELDPALASAHTQLGVVRFYADWDWKGAESELKRAIELNPNDAEAHRTYSFYLAALGRGEEALAESRLAEQTDPLNLKAQTTTGWVLYFSHQYDSAIEQCQKVLDGAPDSFRAHDCLGLGYLAKKKFDQAIVHCEQAVKLSGNDPWVAAGLGQAYALAGRKPEAQKVLEDLRTASRSDYVAPYLFAIVYTAFGEHEEALTWLQKAYNERESYLVYLKVDPAMDALRTNPRFIELLRQVGLPQ